MKHTRKIFVALLVVMTLLMTLATIPSSAETATSTLTNCYTSDSTYWGECGGNASESFIFKFYNGETYMGYTSLNNEDGIIDGDVYVSWHIKLDAASNTDEYWTMEWEIQPTITMQPTRVEHWVDGVKAADVNIEPNGSDGLNPVIAAKTDSEGKILSYIRCSGFNTSTATAALQTAIDASGEGDTIALLSNVTLTETITIPAGANVTLDLNGKTVSMVQSETVTSNHEMIENYGNLTIEDTEGNGKLSYQYTGASLSTSYAANTIVSEPGSTLTVKSGTVENLTYDSAVIAYAIDGRTNGGLGDVSVVIEGGTITSERQAIRIFANSTTNTGSLEISGGEITGRVIVQNSNTSANKAAMKITGGTFNANSYKSDVLYVGGSNGATIDMQPVVCGGTFNGEITSAMTTAFISGGIFSTDVSEYCVDGFVCEDNGDGTYGVQELVVAKVGDEYFADIQEAIKAAAPAGTVELLSDVNVDEWVMFAESLSIGNGKIITLVIDGMTINGNGYTLTVNSIESAGNGNHLFYDATNLNINDLTIKYADGLSGGIGLKSGTLNNVNFEGGVYGVLPGAGDVTITGCTFKTTGTSIYFEEARDNLVVTGNTFENDANANVILLRGGVTFTGNTIISGRTVNVVSGSPVVTGNDFGDVRFKVYNTATATISENTINNLVFDDESAAKSTFNENTLSESAQAALDAVTPVDLPEAEVTEITNPDLTFALNFKIKDYDKLSDEYLEKLMAFYGEYYVDYIITIEGLTDPDVTFNANGNADGFLAGQYDAWSSNWVNVPFEDVTINNDGKLYIMATAAELLGKTGLRYTLYEIADVVKDFDCGIYFTPEFLMANPDMVVTLDLVIFTEDAEGNIVDSTTLATNVFTARETVELPEAEVTPIENPDLTFALNFKIKDYDKLSDEYLEKLMAFYGEYYVDYVITIEGLTDPDVTFNANGNADGFLAGQYDAWSSNWVNVPFEDVTINNDGKLYIMATAAELLGKTGLRYTLYEIADVVKDFDCGIYFTPEFIYANLDMKITLDLVIFTEDAEGNIVDSTTLATNVFTALDAVELPEAEVTDISDSLTENDPELTYALNFRIKDYENFTEAYINALFKKYGKYYVDYVLTIEGLTDTEAIFNANGSADGYLAGQYDAWSTNWVSVPFEDVTINNGDSLYIMEYAAKLMGKGGLRMTLEEIATIVMDFDCGIFFAPEFLDNNRDMVVTLELVVFTEDADGNIVDRHSLATNVFTVADSDFEGAIAEVGGKKYYDIDEALAALDEGELIRFLRDFELAAQQVMTKTVTVDYNGFNVTVSGSSDKAFVAGKGFTMIAIDHDMFAIIGAPHIGENGNWWVGNEDTGVKANGEDGKSPIFKIEDDGHLYVSYDGESWEDLGKVVGEDGKDAITPEFKIEDGILYITYDVDKADEEKVWVPLGSVKGDKGDQGLPGAAGLGVDKVEINAEGHLIITYTDGNTKDLGLVVGKDGKDGVGIANAEIKDGELVITYTNGTTANLGKVVGDKGETGATGIGVAEVKINENGELVITYTNGDSITLGKVVGDKGDKGDQGEPGQDGLGVDKVEINAEGKLVIFYTNGTSVTLDKVVGENGKDGVDGEDGAAGVGVAEVKINENGELVITYTNGTYANLGKVVGKDGENGSNGSNGSDGKDGVGVKNVAIDTDGNLIITLTDDSTINLGKIVGADGEDGANGEDGEDGINGKTPIFKLDENGDIFVRYDEVEEWKLLGNIMGQTGEQGQPGENGEDGKGADGITSLSVILIAIIAVAAIGISTVAIIMVNSHSYKPWWMI